MALRNLRNQKEVSQHKLAGKSKITRSLIAMYETGKRNPSPSNIKAILTALGCSQDDLKNQIKEIQG